MSQNKSAVRPAGAGAEYISEIIGGQSEGRTFLYSLGSASPDALADCIESMIGNRARLRGFLRAIQKKLEQSNVR